MENSSKYDKVRLHYKIWISGNQGHKVIDDERMELLRLIKELGSLKEATDKMGISYRKAWGDMRDCEEGLGFALIEKQRGGQAGGHTMLTDEGNRLLEAYTQLHEKFRKEVNEVIIDFKRTIKGKKSI
ncbi:MAG: LysR family transcriptional regulator [Bacteroidales bacterium]|nr:LysR family transcriptional regulator [Bacteroidales bacterium]